MAREIGQRRLDQAQRRDLEQLLSRQFESLGEVRPTAPRIAEGADSLRFAFAWPLASWEARLARSGRQDRLESFRAEFLRSIAPSLAEVVELATGRRARSPRTRLGADGHEGAVEFALGATTDDEAESRRAIRNWSTQVRRNARRQRAEHRRQIEAIAHTLRAAEERRKQVHHPAR